jgi:putative hydrolase of the HAD superfamily
LIALDDVEVLVLDLDDTLYLERDYVRSGFRAVSDWLSATGATSTFFEVAWPLFETGRRGDVFNAALDRLGIEPSPELIAELVVVYRGHAPDIALCADAERFLGRVQGSFPLALITDGAVASQSAKISALGLNSRFDLLIFTDRWGEQFRKPHPRAFTTVEAHWPSVASRRIAYIGDNPRKDFAPAIRRGWRTVRMHRSDGEHASELMLSADAADHVAATFDEINVPSGRRPVPVSDQGPQAPAPS